MTDFRRVGDLSTNRIIGLNRYVVSGETTFTVMNNEMGCGCDAIVNHNHLFRKGGHLIAVDPQHETGGSWPAEGV